MGFSEEQIENSTKHIWTLMAKILSNLRKKMSVQIEKAQWTPSKINTEAHPKTHYNSTLKNKKLRISKASREKDFTTYEGSSIRLTVYFLSEIMEAKGTRI